MFGGFGPDERSWVLVPGFDPVADVFLQGLDAAVVAAVEQVLGEVGQEALDLVDPRGVGRVWWAWKRGSSGDRVGGGDHRLEVSGISTLNAPPKNLLVLQPHLFCAW